MNALRRFASTRTPKNFFLQKAVGNRPFRLLDVGAGNHSPSKTVRLFPQCEYHGLDLSKDERYNAADEAALAGFYVMDLTALQFEAIPDAYFDYINIAHVIEHLHNGDAVLRGLAKKLKSGGHIYIEYPGQRSTRLPSMHNTLNFYDDATHVRVYTVPEVESVLKGEGFRVLASGTRRSWSYILAIPARVLQAWIGRKKVQGNVFWDLLGFAEYVFARKGAGH